VTALPRTLIDLAATVPFDWLAMMVERAEELRLFDLHAVDDLLNRLVGHQGHAKLRKAIALYKPSSFTRSGLEKRFLELVLEAGLPQPHTNFVEQGFELDCSLGGDDSRDGYPSQALTASERAPCRGSSTPSGA
jgi:hypothetical protein